MEQANIIEGVEKIQHDKKNDERGSFLKIYPFSPSLEVNKNIIFFIKEVFFSYSNSNVVRGMHLQTFPFESKKIVTCLKGEILDVLIDLRKNSPTFMLINQFNISQHSGFSLLIPRGVAHGYSVIGEFAEVVYFSDEDYKIEYDLSINPLTIGFDWKIEEPIISPRDLKAISLNDYLNIEDPGKNQ